MRDCRQRQMGRSCAAICAAKPSVPASNGAMVPTPLRARSQAPNTCSCAASGLAAPTHRPSFGTTTRRSRRMWRRRARPCRRTLEQEFEDYLACGRLEHGFLRVRCDSCHAQHLVAFSCKRRGFYSGHPALRPAGPPAAMQNRSRRFWVRAAAPGAWPSVRRCRCRLAARAPATAATLIDFGNFLREL